MSQYRCITAVEEAKALPLRTVLMTVDDRVIQKDSDPSWGGGAPHWWTINSDQPEEELARLLPARVLYNPDEPGGVDLADLWDEAFDAGERDAFSHQTFDEPCIPNPYRMESD